MVCAAGSPSPVPSPGGILELFCLLEGPQCWVVALSQPCFAAPGEECPTGLSPKSTLRAVCMPKESLCYNLFHEEE